MMSFEIWYDLGNLLLEKQQLLEAETAYRKTIGVKPDYAEAFCNLGRVLRELGRMEEATQLYQRLDSIRKRSM